MKNTTAKKGKRTTIRSSRFDDNAVARMEEMLQENPLVKPSILIRAGILALYRMEKSDRYQVILDAAAH
ncbi:hypothetical protein ACI2I2_19940 [Scandinavium sp. NPDC088450]|uniref:hypothetical protein n=1 Tax=Scandinavium sp. NPDC088450 TaxID=3364514 RepID=UPI00384FD9FE